MVDVLEASGVNAAAGELMVAMSASGEVVGCVGCWNVRWLKKLESDETIMEKWEKSTLLANNLTYIVIRIRR